MKKLKGIAFRGMGLLEIAEPEEFIERCIEVLGDVKEGEYVGNSGIADICETLGESGLKDWLAPVVHRHSACYNTPYPTNTFVYLEEDPKKLEEPDLEEPGVLITDSIGLAGFYKLGLTPQDAGKILRQCAKLGIDPAAAAELCEKSGKKAAADIQGALPDLTGEVTRPGSGIFSPWCPMQPVFGEFDDIDDDIAGWWERRQAVAYIFGIHPVFAVISPDIMEEDLVDLAAIGTDLDITDDTLAAAIDYVLS